jgi:hypothetical protein
LKVPRHYFRQPGIFPDIDRQPPSSDLYLTEVLVDSAAAESTSVVVAFSCRSFL